MNQITYEKARSLIGKTITKDGNDYGKIVEIITRSTGYTTTFIAITDKDVKIDVASIFRMIRHLNGPEVHYPDGTDYSVKVMRSPKRKGGGRAITGNTTPNNLNTKEKE